jgi:hypothetical protein
MNLTRFDYQKSAFEGWRLRLSMAGTLLGGVHQLGG